MVGPAMVAKLNACERHGDPLDSGCVWARVAELSLVGGLGCGALLVGQLLERMRDGEINAPDGKKCCIPHTLSTPPHAPGRSPQPIPYPLKLQEWL